MPWRVREQEWERLLSQLDVDVLAFVVHWMQVLVAARPVRAWVVKPGPRAELLVIGHGTGPLR